MISRALITVILSCIFATAAIGQRTSVLVQPANTDPNITTNLTSHYVSINRTVTPRGRLFVMLPGTDGLGIHYLEINQTAADLGFHAVSLTYPNNDAINTLCGAPNTDLDCYSRARLETIDGTDRTPILNVNRPNSIENRIIKLLIYLRDRSPADNWGQFLINDSTLDWSKIVIAGHSQGGGHAGIIGRYKPVARVIMFAAMDFNALTNSPANWIAVPASTPNASTPDKFYGFCHLRDDAVNFTLLSTRIWPLYGLPQFGAIVNVDTTATPYGNSHQLTTDINCDTTHGCTVVDARLVRDTNGVPVFKPVWEYLLTAAAPTSVSGVRFSKAGAEIARIPSGVSAKSYRLIVDGAGFDTGSRAIVNDVEVSTEFLSPTSLRIALPAGPTRPAGRSNLKIRGVDGAFSNSITF